MTRPGRLSIVVAAASVVVITVALYVLDDEPTRPAAAVPVAALTPANTTSARPPADVDNGYMQVVREGLPTPGCEDFRQPPAYALTRDQMADELRRAADVLSTANDPQLAHAAALLANNPTKRQELLRRASELNPNSPMLAWHRMLACEELNCGDNALYDRAAELDTDNAAVWLTRASLPLQQQDWVLAEAELRQAIASSRFDIYFADHIQLLEEALAASSNLNYTDRVALAVGNSAAVAIPQYGEITDACANEENDPETWINLCDMLGASMVMGGQTLLDISIGYALQKISAERRGDYEIAALFQRRSDETIKNTMRDVTMSGANALMENDPAFHMDYIDHLSTFGELTAFRSAINEANRLRSDPTYDQCNFVLRREDNP